MTQQTMFLKNTETFAESLARCGVKFHFAYPITPATDVMKRMAVILPQYGGKMLQMESELAVSSALAGASRCISSARPAAICPCTPSRK